MNFQRHVKSLISHVPSIPCGDGQQNIHQPAQSMPKTNIPSIGHGLEGLFVSLMA